MQLSHQDVFATDQIVLAQFGMSLFWDWLIDFYKMQG